MVRNPLLWEKWNDARELLGKEADTLHGALTNEHAQLWVFIKNGELRCALITELIDDGGTRECFLRLVGGYERADWLPFLHNEITDWARLQGCTAMELNGRLGWQKVFPDWEATLVLRREI